MTLKPNRIAALEKLTTFQPAMGLKYAQKRNFDFGEGHHKHVSVLSAYVRHRILSEQELVAAALQAHEYAKAEKFIQEVFWRTYWKGWLERRPDVWLRYEADVQSLHQVLQKDQKLAQKYRKATEGKIGIDCFDAWTGELRTTGYLHNHARMWFASIWIFTLKLPWQLGADFFLQHLLDGDTASNTLSWRWVAGLQTKGKTYLARADNIKTYTNGRFNPVGQLAEFADPFDDEIPEALPSPEGDALPMGPLALLVTDDCLDPLAHLPAGAVVKDVIILDTVNARSPMGVSNQVQRFTSGLMKDCVERLNDKNIKACVMTPDTAMSALQKRGTDETVAALYAPMGTGRTALDQIAGALGARIPRDLPDWDKACFPFCKKGFFPFKKEIPGLIERLTG